jgi:serine/threonine-protein kinase HipA
MNETHVFVDLPGQGYVPAGHLRMDVQSERIHSATFRYAGSYVERRDAFAIDPLRLPLPSDDVSNLPDFDLQVNGDFAGAIRDASPDFHGRSVLARAAGRAAINEFEHLVASGSQRVGALAFGPTTDGPECATYWTTVPNTGIVKLETLLEGHQAFEEDETKAEAFLRIVDAAASFGGARPKAAVAHEGRRWLVKFPKKGDAYDAVRAEHAVMRMARDAGFDVPLVHLVKVRDTTLFLIERFDRIVGAAGEIEGRIPFASAMSLTGETETTARYGSYEAIAKAIGRFGTSPRRETAELFRRALFNVLVGNDDDHLRNHGFLYDHAGKGWSLSPLYDVSPRPMLSHDRRLAISLLADRELRDATVDNVVSVSGIFGIDGEEADAMAKDLSGFVSANWEAYLSDSGMTRTDIERMASCFVQSETVPARDLAL